MPTSLARKLLICAAVDGLIIQPLTPKGQRNNPTASPGPSASPVKLRYGDASVVCPVPRDQLLEPNTLRPNASFEAFGIIGLFTVARLSYLVTITGRQQVAQIRGHPVYVVTDVALTPCTTQAEAEAAVRHTSVQLRRASASSRDRSATRGYDGGSTTDSDTDGDSVSILGNDADADEVQSDRELTGGNGEDDEDGNTIAKASARGTPGGSSIAEDVIRRKGSYGRFAQRWFSHRGWVQDQKRNMGLSDTHPSESTSTLDAKRQDKADKQLSEAVVAETAKEGVATAVSVGESLLPKLLRMAHIWFGTSRSFYFSYDVDITRNLGNRGLATVEGTSLYRNVDPMFFWNRHLLKPFMSAGQDALLLPVMQGFVGQREFIVDQHPPQVDSDKAPESMELKDWTPFGSGAASPPPEGQQPERKPINLRPSEKRYLITVISRRSVERAGLRYLRRGIDDHGNAANCVETEQLLSSPSWAGSNIFSFVQIRGSIPVFFTQTPYSLKPVPELQHSEAANLAALTRHFDFLRQRYGYIQVVNLIEKHGVESVVGRAFQQNVRQYNGESVEGGEDKGPNEKKVAFEWFDFHSACRGMKFENVSLLLDILEAKIDSWGSTVEAAPAPAVGSVSSGNDNSDSKAGEITERQKAVLRTNCMDCLDRTNVCQSSFAKHVLEAQLKSEGFDMSAQIDQTTSWFNTLWADNGDAISKQYASTAAMKGDYTRTRKRDYRGMVNDLGLSLTRFYNGYVHQLLFFSQFFKLHLSRGVLMDGTFSMVNDYFSQAAIDFFLGNVTSLVFEEFEANMMTKDPAVSMSKMREQAIETSQKIVIENPEQEDLIGGWTLLSPHQTDTVKTLPFEEVVLLLTDVALYVCRFDWKLDKVSSFERVDLAHIVSIRIGTYITSTISPAQVDEDKNVGLVVTYEPGKNDIRRVNTRSLSNRFPGGVDAGNPGKPSNEPEDGPNTPPSAPTGGLLGPIFSPSKKQVAPAPSRQQKKIALKALYAHSSIADARASGADDYDGRGGGGHRVLSEHEQIDVVASEIERLALISQPLFQDQDQGQYELGGKTTESGKRSLIEKGDIISLAEARKNTGILETLGHAMKKLVWA
jgi:hypothetical protein